MYKTILFLILSCAILSCKEKEAVKNEISAVEPNFKNKGHQLVYNMVSKVGDYEALWKKKDVSYKYTYTTPDGKADVSIEKYIFEGEYSYGKYILHERTLPNLEGVIEQGYDGKTFWLKNNGELMNDPEYLRRVAFNRPTNYYWFTMMQKLLDPGLNYEYLGQKEMSGKKYDLVKVTFESVGDKPKDIYQLYINQETSLVDQFLFTVADFGIMKPKLMELEYEKIDGLLIPTKRRYKNSNWDAEIFDEPWIKVTWEDIKFNSGMEVSEFEI